MKKLFIASVLLISTLLGFTSCNEDITLSGEFQETAVVYGLLDVSDSVHMIKITRAFIGPGNSIEIANNPDSSYFTTVEATIKEKVNGVVLRTWILEDTIVDNKETNGIWYAPEQKLYYFSTPTSSPLRADAAYELNIIVNGGEFEVKGFTSIVSGLSIGSSAVSTYQFGFAQNAGEYKNAGITVQAGAGNNKAAVINVRLEIGYEEITGSIVDTLSFDWNLGEQEVGVSTSKSFSAQGEVFYDLIKRHIQANGAPICDKRNLSYIKIKVVGGASDLYNYMLVNQPSTSVAQNKPTYTNLEASNGRRVIGIFSSRQTYETFKPFYDPSVQNNRCININSTEELCIGQYTGPYLFCSDHSADSGGANPKPWACQ